MAKSITRWEPDTHPGVIIDLEVDSNNPTAEPVFKRFGHKDDIYEKIGNSHILAHTGGSSQKPQNGRFSSLVDGDIYLQVLTENQTKNIGIGEILEIVKSNNAGGDSSDVIPEIGYTIGEDGIVEFDIDSINDESIKETIREKIKVKNSKIK